MKFTAALLGLAAVAAANPLFERAPQCAKDNCERAVAGQRAATTAAADCRSYMDYTVTPSPIFKTVTVDRQVPVRIGIVIPNSEVTARPTALPAYASACSASGRYLSACSCLGLKTALKFASTPTFTFFVSAPTATDA